MQPVATQPHKYDVREYDRESPLCATHNHYARCPADETADQAIGSISLFNEKYVLFGRCIDVRDYSNQFNTDCIPEQTPPRDTDTDTGQPAPPSNATIDEDSYALSFLEPAAMLQDYACSILGPSKPQMMDTDIRIVSLREQLSSWEALRIC